MRTDFDKIWTKMIKNDDEYATQATFSLSYFDAMTHILLGQNCMKTQAKYDFFQKHHPISTFCAC